MVGAPQNVEWVPAGKTARQGWWLSLGLGVALCAVLVYTAVEDLPWPDQLVADALALPILGILLVIQARVPANVDLGLTREALLLRAPAAIRRMEWGVVVRVGENRFRLGRGQSMLLAPDQTARLLEFRQKMRGESDGRLPSGTAYQVESCPSCKELTPVNAPRCARCGADLTRMS